MSKKENKWKNAQEKLFQDWLKKFSELEKTIIKVQDIASEKRVEIREQINELKNTRENFIKRFEMNEAGRDELYKQINELKDVQKELKDFIYEILDKLSGKKELMLKTVKDDDSLLAVRIKSPTDLKPDKQELLDREIYNEPSKSMFIKKSEPNDDLIDHDIIIKAQLAERTKLIAEFKEIIPIWFSLLKRLESFEAVDENDWKQYEKWEQKLKKGVKSK